MPKMTHDLQCGPCARKKSNSIAYKHCKECDDYFCWTCYRNHGTFKPLLHHKVVDYNEEKRDGYESASYETCQVHENAKLEYFCVTHDSLCCKLCFTSRHKTCRKSLPIVAAADGFKHSSLNQQFQKELSTATEILNALSKKCKKDKTKLNKIMRQMETQVKKLKSEIIQHVNNLEGDTLTEIESVSTQLSSSLERYQNGTNLCISTINEIDEKYKSATKSDSESEQYLLVKSFQDNVLPNIYSFIDQTKSFELPKMEICTSNIMSRMDSIGSLRIHKSIKSKERLKYEKHHQQTYVPRKLKLGKTHTLGKNFPFTSTEITGIGVTRDDRLILCNRAESNILLCSPDLQDRSEIRLIGEPWAIAVDSDIDEVWVTIPDKHSIQHVNITEMTSHEPLGVASGCFGIALIEDNIALGRWGEVQIISREGACLKSFNVGKSTIHSLLPGKNWSLFCCEGDEGKFHCIKIHDGTNKFEYKTDEFKWPVSVVTDIQDNIYVLGLKSHNLHRIDPKGKFLDELLTESDDLDFPRCMTFNKNYSKLYVSNNLGESISVYTCKYV